MNRGINKEELKYFIKIINAIQLTLDTLPELDHIYTDIESQFIIKWRALEKGINRFMN